MDKQEKTIKTVEVLLKLLENDEEMNKYLSKGNIHINESKQQLVSKILNLFSNEKSHPINTIIDALEDILEDKKIKLSEMVKLVNIFVKIIKDLKITRIDIGNEELVIVIKLIIIIFDEIKIINIENNELELIFETIDSCVFLFEQLDEVELEISTISDEDSKDSKKSKDSKDSKESDKEINTTIIDEKSSCKFLCFKFKF